MKSKLQLPSVTLVMIETREHELARMAVEDCVRVADFGDVLILTDRSELFNGLGARTHNVPDWPTKEGWARSMWFDVPPLLKTSHMLAIQWDAWIWDASMWRDDFLNYDYIGAPWWYKDGKNVGNSGFCLKSTALARYIRKHRAQFECNTSAEDDLLCRTYRRELETAGFRWAPEAIAHDFAFECCRPSPTSQHFGFHAAFNFGEVLDRDRLIERTKLMLQSPYITNPNGVIWKAFSQKYPELLAELQPQLSPNSKGVLSGS